MSANNKNLKPSGKRYLVTLRYYAYAKDDESVKKESIAFAGQLNKEQDCQASVDEILDAPFGKVGKLERIM